MNINDDDKCTLKSSPFLSYGKSVKYVIANVFLKKSKKKDKKKHQQQQQQQQLLFQLL
jgi:hypothetical protein